MKHCFSFLVVASAMLFFMACGKSQKPMPEVALAEALGSEQNDSTIYGLACDGCTDTILVLLSNVESEPDTFNILKATKMHRVFGRPKIGDRLAVVRSPKDSTVADMVIDLEDLRGQWVVLIPPTLRERADHPGLTQKQLAELLPDSLREVLMVPHEYGFQIKNDNTMRPLGVNYNPTTTDDELPVKYPVVKRYREWKLLNGNILLTVTELDSLGQSHPTLVDTCSFVYLQGDSLALRFNDGVQGFYRKPEGEKLK